MSCSCNIPNNEYIFEAIKEILLLTLIEQECWSFNCFRFNVIVVITTCLHNNCFKSGTVTRTKIKKLKQDARAPRMIIIAKGASSRERT